MKLVIEIIGDEGETEYLGRVLNMTNMHEAEMKSRTTRAWAKFAKHKAELTCKDIPINLRLKLFDAVVTPTMLYGAGTWAMTKDMETQLRTVQRKMLRSITSTQSFLKFQTTEDYVEWVRAATRKAEALMAQHNVED